jgi:hypothetical protein
LAKINMTSEPGTEAKYPFAADRAFLGFATRKPYLRYSFDGRRLVLWEVWYVRALIWVVGAFMGPGFTALIVTGRMKPLPWPMWLLLVAVNVVAWLGWIDALRNRYQVVCDLVGGEVQFLLHPWRAPKSTLSLADVDDVTVETIRRVRGKGNQMRALSDDEILRRKLVPIDCFNVVLVRRDGSQIHLVETTDRSVADSIREILLGAIRRQ